ncbi:16S rRNA (cytosine(1402)-N(4))-methyltransferase RsmH [Patescibacteria group bacterium]|nr:16S rRNA (cytosine(1402)-N(4))-methyltransferase RsmH [Patescibacteria group bacterium]
MEYFHQPVLVSEVIDFLNPRSNQNVIDATIGGGGHAETILKKTAPNGHLLGLDRDPRAITAASKNLKKFNSRVTLICDSYKNINKIINEQRSFIHYHHLLLDLGLSSAQVAPDEPRGFSFQSQEALDMRFGPQSDLTAEKIINQWKELDLINIFQNYGEERFARQIAKNIGLYRKDKPIKTAGDLVKLIMRVYGGKRGKIHPATKIFQALRIAVNDELNVLKSSLPEMLDILPVGGRMAVISYHSLEDRIVKFFFKEEAKDCLCPKEIPVCQCHHQAGLKILTKKVIKPSLSEIKENPRSRSAKLRVVEKIV